MHREDLASVEAELRLVLPALRARDLPLEDLLRLDGALSATLDALSPTRRRASGDISQEENIQISERGRGVGNSSL